MQRWPSPRMGSQNCELKRGNRQGMDIRRDAAKEKGEKTKRRKTGGCKSRPGRLEGSWPGFGLDVGMIDGIAFSQNSSRGRRQEEALTHLIQPTRAARQTVDQPCQAPAQPSRPSALDPAAGVGRSQWRLQQPARRGQPQPPTSKPSAGKRPTGRERLEHEGLCHPGPAPTRLPHRPGGGPLVCPAHVFCSPSRD